MLRNLAIAITAVLLVAGSAHSTWFDFSTWDDVRINSDGQNFANIYRDIDLHVRSTKASQPTAGLSEHINLHGNSNSQEFIFEFSEPLPLKVEIHTLDLDEVLTVNSGNAIEYEHVYGNHPVVEFGAFQGTAYGISPDGAANGIVRAGVTNVLTIGYEALATDKFDQISIGVVPEPQSTFPLLFGLVSLLVIRRVRRYPA